MKRTIVLLTLLVVLAASTGSHIPVIYIYKGKYDPPAWSQKLTNKRFVLVLDGEAVLDKETGLVWEKSPDTTPRSWSDAVSYAYMKEVGGRKGWRLPTVEELASLVDTTQVGPALPFGHPFVDVQSDFYWSATTGAPPTPSLAWSVHFAVGFVGTTVLPTTRCVWCVRGGHGYDAY